MPLGCASPPPSAETELDSQPPFQASSSLNSPARRLTAAPGLEDGDSVIQEHGADQLAQPPAARIAKLPLVPVLVHDVLGQVERHVPRTHLARLRHDVRGPLRQRTEVVVMADHGRQAEEARDPHCHLAPQFEQLDAAIDDEVAGARCDHQNVALGLELLLAAGVSAKDVALALIGTIGTAGGTGCTIEFAGGAIRSLSVEGRMTVCNMAIEAGARAGLVAVDDKTLDYVKGRPFAPGGEDWDRAVAHWRTLHSDPGAHFDAVVELDATQIQPQVTWGTSPEMVLPVDGRVPDPGNEADAARREAIERALSYMGLHARQAITDIAIDKVFVGSCTNGRIEDLREAAAVVRRLGRRVAPNVKLALIVPGSGRVKAQAEREGLDEVFKVAGFDWREPGCSMCLAMNADRLEPGERCASTSNRNFEGRQGAGGRTHLVSPAMAAAAAVHGHFIDVRHIG